MGTAFKFTDQTPGPDVVQKVRPGSDGSSFKNRCRHFDGVNFTQPDKCCTAGVRLLDVFVNREYRYQYKDGGAIYTNGYCKPCFKDGDPFGVCKCDKQSFPTQEEIDADEAETAMIIKRVTTARPAIIAHAGGKRGVAGELACPVCGTGQLRYSIAGCNGHVHARCSTDGCVSWME